MTQTNVTTNSVYTEKERKQLHDNALLIDNIFQKVAEKREREGKQTPLRVLARGKKRVSVQGGGSGVVVTVRSIQNGTLPEARKHISR